MRPARAPRPPRLGQQWVGTPSTRSTEQAIASVDSRSDAGRATLRETSPSRLRESEQRGDSIGPLASAVWSEAEATALPGLADALARNDTRSSAPLLSSPLLAVRGKRGRPWPNVLRGRCWRGRAGHLNLSGSS